VRKALASYALAEEFTIIPFPFEGRERELIAAEYDILVDSGASPKEITDMLLMAIEVLLNKRKKSKTQKDSDLLTSKISDMLGRLLVFEEDFLMKK